MSEGAPSEEDFSLVGPDEAESTIGPYASQTMGSLPMPVPENDMETMNNRMLHLETALAQVIGHLQQQSASIAQPSNIDGN